jgi:hypothetical protein
VADPRGRGVCPDLRARPLILYIIGPLRSRGSPVKANCEFKEISLDDFPDTAKEKISDIAQMLASSGFVAASHARIDNHIPNSELYQSIWLSTADESMAIVQVVRLHSERGERMFTVCSFATEFEGASCIGTSDSAQPPVFVHDPKENTVRWPGVKPIGLLLQLHRARVARLRGSRRGILPTPDKLLERMARDHRESMERQVAAGYYWHDHANYVYRTTLKGAFLMRWRLLRPWKQIAYTRNETRLRADLEAIGLQRWHQGLPI